MTDFEPDRDSIPDRYLADRQLATGTAGSVLLTALGVSYVVAGDYAAWNYGLAQSGWGGLIVALALMALMYLCLVFSLAELASAIPTAGGAYAFARRAFGPTGGFLTGLCVIIEYVVLAGAIGIFLTGYFTSLTGLNGIWLHFAFYAVFLVINILGVGEALKVLLVLTLVAVAGILIFAVMNFPLFSFANLSAPTENAPGGGLFPFGLTGVWAGLPFGMAFFLAIEGLPLASEEALDPAKSVPRAMLAAWVVLGVLALLILVSGPGSVGAQALIGTDSPLVAGLRALAGGQMTNAARLVNFAGLVALAASFFSTIYAYSRQIFALSRAGYLPRALSLTNRYKAPWLAILVPGVFALFLSIIGSGEALVVMGVFCATASYLLMLAAFIRLRKVEPNLLRPYRTPGGVLTAAVAFILAFAAFIACLLVNLLWSLLACGVIGAIMAYFWFYSRHHLVAQAPEEEFAAIRVATNDVR